MVTTVKIIIDCFGLFYGYVFYLGTVFITRELPLNSYYGQMHISDWLSQRAVTCRIDQLQMTSITLMQWHLSKICNRDIFLLLFILKRQRFLSHTELKLGRSVKNRSKVVNHSARKTLLHNDIHPIHVVQLTGHKNHYNTVSRAQQRNMSNMDVE